MTLEHDLMRMLAISACVGLVLQAIKVGVQIDKRSSTYKRMQPMVAMVLGALMGYFALRMVEAVDRALWGMIAGGFSSGGYGIVQAFVRGAKVRAEAGELPSQGGSDEH